MDEWVHPDIDRDQNASQSRFGETGAVRPLLQTQESARCRAQSARTHANVRSTTTVPSVSAERQARSIAVECNQGAQQSSS